MELNGSVINFLGDSITEGVGASCRENGFVSVFARMYGAKANNYGIGGTRIARQSVVTQERRDRDFCMRMDEMDESADAVVVFGGTNDFGHGDAPFGTMQDRTPQTFCGACHDLMSRLLERYAGKPIVIITPLHRLRENCEDGDGSGLRANCTLPLSSYREAIMEIAAYYSLPVLDLYATSGMQPAVQACRERLMPDGLHPSDEGHAIIARRVGEFLKTL